MIYFKYKLQLKFRINKYFSPITVNFHTGLRKNKYFKTKLKL